MAMRAVPARWDSREKAMIGVSFVHWVIFVTQLGSHFRGNDGPSIRVPDPF
jgi:hypothetical protein